MNQKKVLGVFLIITLLFLFSNNFIIAEENSSTSETKKEGFEKAYECLESLVEDKDLSSLSVEENSFALMSLAYNSNLKNDLKSSLLNKKSDNCWLKDSCSIKDTALSILALDYSKESTENYVGWLSNQTTVPTELIWLLQIDTSDSEEAECTISYNNEKRTIKIDSSKKITGNFGSCLRSAYGGYWLEISSSGTCQDNEYEISCNKDFFTSLAYKKKTQSTYYISSLTNSGSAGGTTKEKVNSFCFGKKGTCDYESSLWAAYALKKTGKGVNKFLPYLTAFADENKQYLSYAFLYLLTENYEEHLTNLISAQKLGGYWQESTSNKRFYDTALALLALSGSGSGQDSVQDAKEFLINNQQENGCWQNSIRDTSFILFSVYPKSPSGTSGGVSPSSGCIEFGHYCVSESECSLSDRLPNFECSGHNICCNKEPDLKSCFELNGEECTADQTCTGRLMESSDTLRCCISGICESEGSSSEPMCEEVDDDYMCRPSSSGCSENEVKNSYKCNFGDVCCAPKSTATKPSKSYWWIWLLVILIILLVLAIIFKNQLKVWSFRFRNNFKKGPVKPGTRPSSPPSGNQMQMPVRRPIPPQQFRAPQRPIRPGFNRPNNPNFAKQKELDETLRKLKEIGN